MRAKQKFKKGTFSRRVFSILMALAMVITLMPMNAMEVKAEDATEITSIELNVDWSKIPKLTVGQNAPSFYDFPATVSGTGVAGIEDCEWVVYALPEHVELGYVAPGVYAGYENHWVPLKYYRYNVPYTINAADTYAFVINLVASDGYCFAEGNGADLKDIVKSNVEVAHTQSEGRGLAAAAILKLGTVSEIAAKTEGAKPTPEVLTNIDIQVDTTKIPTLKVGDPIPNYGSQPAENSPFSFSDEVSYKINSDVRTTYGFGYYEYDEEGYYTDSEGNKLNSAPCIGMKADATTLYAYYIELIAATGYTFGDAVTICNGNNRHFVVEEIGIYGEYIGIYDYIRIRYDMGTLQDIEDIKNESGGTTPEPTPTPDPTPEPTPTPDPTPEVHTHTIVTDAAVAPTCTETGKTEGKHCSVCGEVITAQTTVAALGHDWSNDWVVTKPATTITEGKKECTCKREGCNQKKYEVIPVIGTPADPNEGKLDKDAEVAPEAPIKEATLDNTKTELLSAPAIFTADEKKAIDKGAKARVWMEVSKTDESSIKSPDMTKISDAAKSIMGDNPSITYFDADLFKQVGNGPETQLHEPGIDIEVTIKVPENLLNGDNNFEREYKIIRLHKGLVNILSGTFDKVTGEFTFKTDRFSTYAIAYTDKKLVTGDSDNGGNNVDNNSGDNNQSNEDANTPANTKEDKKPYVEAPKTGDASNVTLWSLLLALSALALAGIRVARRKRSSSIEK